MSIILSIVTFVTMASADGTILLAGKVRSLSPTQITIEDKNQIYTLERAKIPAADRQRLEKVRAGQNAEIHAPFTAIAAVKNVKETK